MQKCEVLRHYVHFQKDKIWCYGGYNKVWWLGL